jgi:glycosyltransferase involved in cell wall biosynthesis
MEIALFAPDLTGHRLHWLRQLLLTAEDRTVEVFVYTTSDSDGIKDLTSLPLNLKNLVCNESPQALFDRWSSDVKGGKFLGVSWESDKILHKMVFARGRYRLLILRPYLEKKNLPGVFRFLLKQILIFLLRHLRNVEVGRLSIPFASKESEGFRWVRDDFNTEKFGEFGIDTEKPFEISQIPTNAKIVALLGYIDERKNPLEAYKIIEEVRVKTDSHIYFVIAGAQSNEARSQLSEIKNPQHLVLLDRVLSKSEYRSVIDASRVLLLPYANRGASGIVLNSLVVGTPVLLKGGRNWDNLQKASDRMLRVEGANREKMVSHLCELLTQPKKSSLGILETEPIPRLSDFLLKK